MLQRSSLTVFLVRLALAYVLLLLPWPGLSEACGLYFRTVGQTVLARESEQYSLTFEAPKKNSPRPQDSLIAIVNLDLMAPDGSGPVRHLNFDTRDLGWKPLALLIALILASPLAWRRRLRALLLGALCSHGFMLLTLGVATWNEAMEIGLVTLTPFWKAVAVACKELLTRQITLVVPVLIWILVTFRREDFTGKRGLLALGSPKSEGDIQWGLNETAHETASCAPTSPSRLPGQR